MTTATPQTLTARQLAAVRSALHIRDTALADLQAAPTKLRTTWGTDRLADVGWANQQVEKLARQVGMGPAELIAACSAAG